MGSVCVSCETEDSNLTVAYDCLKRKPGCKKFSARTATTHILQDTTVSTSQSFSRSIADLHAIKNNKSRLVLHNRVTPSTSHLTDSIDAADEDCPIGDDDGSEEAFEVFGIS